MNYYEKQIKVQNIFDLRKINKIRHARNKYESKFYKFIMLIFIKKYQIYQYELFH